MKFSFFFFIICLPLYGVGQHTVSGKVVTEKGEPLSQASVFISNSFIGTNTNTTGEFVLTGVPATDITVVVSHVGYEVATVSFAAAAQGKRYIIQLQAKSNELAGVVVGKYDKRGWRKWGQAFTAAFTGTSAYARDCEITNKDAVFFKYNKEKKQLQAYAPEALRIENRALGYHIAVTLVDFLYDFSKDVVDYQVYTLFTEMEGNDDQELEWRKAREAVYSFSLMHFMRALHARNFKNEGFQVRKIEVTPNSEKQRVQALYNTAYTRLKDSLGSEAMNETAVNKLVEKNVAPDSLRYYRSRLEEQDRTENLHLELLNFKDIARATDNNTVLLQFDGYLQVTYAREKEPAEYTAYKYKRFAGSHTGGPAGERSYPSTELRLTQGLPIEVSENGYFNNIDLFTAGFWGWWEKLATRLPYEYEP